MEYVVYNPDGTERERTARSVGSRDWLRILHMTCWDTTGHIITPTAEQALETLHSEEVPGLRYVHNHRPILILKHSSVSSTAGP